MTSESSATSTTPPPVAPVAQLPAGPPSTPGNNNAPKDSLLPAPPSESKSEPNATTENKTGETTPAAVKSIAFDDKKPAPELTRANFAKRESDRILELEEEVQELRRKLERAEARLVTIFSCLSFCYLSHILYLQSQKEGSAGVLAREVALERELDDAHRKLAVLRQEKQNLEQSVKVTLDSDRSMVSLSLLRNCK